MRLQARAKLGVVLGTRIQHLPTHTLGAESPSDAGTRTGPPASCMGPGVTLPGAFGAGWAWLCIWAPLPSCVTLGKSLRLPKPLLPPHPTWGGPSLRAAWVHLGGFHGVAAEALAAQWGLRKSLFMQLGAPRWPTLTLAFPAGGPAGAHNRSCFYLTRVPGTSLGAQPALPHAHPPEMPTRKLGFREVRLLAQGHRASEGHWS